MADLDFNQLRAKADLACKVWNRPDLMMPVPAEQLLALLERAEEAVRREAMLTNRAEEIDYLRAERDSLAAKLDAIRPVLNELDSDIFCEHEDGNHYHDAHSAWARLEREHPEIVVWAVEWREHPAKKVLDGRAVPDESKEGGEHHGDGPCMDCGGLNLVVWFTDNVLWNDVVGGPGTTDDPGGLLCIPCFVRRAERRYAMNGWRLVPEWPWPARWMEPARGGGVSNG